MAKKAAATDDPTDALVQRLLAEVEKRQNAIERAGRADYKTNMTFSYVEGKLQDTVNLNVCADVRKLLDIYAFLLQKAHFYNLAAEAVGSSEVPPFTWDGFKVEAWLSDIQARIDKVQITTKKRELAELEAELNELVSPEQRRAMKLKAIEARLANG